MRAMNRSVILANLHRAAVIGVGSARNGATSKSCNGATEQRRRDAMLKRGVHPSNRAMMNRHFESRTRSEVSTRSWVNSRADSS